jgi:hypothetical protein
VGSCEQENIFLGLIKVGKFLVTVAFSMKAVPLELVNFLYHIGFYKRLEDISVLYREKEISSFCVKHYED